MNIISSTIQHFKTPIHEAGKPFILIAACINFAMLLLGWALFGSSFLGLLFLILTLWVVYFFRCPNRVIPQDENLILAAGDGVICDISQTIPPEETGIKDELTKVSIFLSVFDVHANRIPISGIITKSHYHEGQFLNASLDKASEKNERQTLVIQNNDIEIVCVQIAGLVARRILCDVEQGDHVEAGDVYGIIRFGSRIDIYLPNGIKPMVKQGQKIIAGETIIADLKNRLVIS